VLAMWPPVLHISQHLHHSRSHVSSTTMPTASRRHSIHTAD